MGLIKNEKPIMGGCYNSHTALFETDTYLWGKCSILRHIMKKRREGAVGFRVILTKK